MRETVKEGVIIIMLTLAVGTLAYGFALPAWADVLVTALCGSLPFMYLLSRERRIQQARNQHTHDFIQRLIDVIPEPVYVKDASSRYVMVNEALAAEKGTTIDDMIGKSSIHPLLTAERAQVVRDEDAAVLRGQRVFKEERVTHLRTGEVRYKMVMKGSCIDTNGRAVIVGTNFDITPWRVAEMERQASLEREQAQHRASWEFIQRILDVIPHPIYVKDAQSRFLLLNKTLAEHKGVPLEELIGHTGLSEKTPADTMRRHFEEDGNILAGLVVRKEDYKRHHRTGEEMYRMVTKSMCTDPDGNSVIVGAHFDITGMRQAEKELKATLERETELRQRTQDFLQRVIDVIPDPVYIKSVENEFVMVNDAFAKEYKRDKLSFIGTAARLTALNHADAVISAQEDDYVINGGTVSKEQQLIDPNTGGDLFRVVAKHRCVNIDGSPVIVGIYFNVTRWKVAERELQRLAQEDSLTGIANRRHFHTETERCLSRADRHDEPVSLCMFDLDHFKRVNDEYGHQTGDEVLVETVRRARSCLRNYDVFARWGGEEFIVLLPLTHREDAMMVAERIRQVISQTPFSTSCGELNISISGGIAQRNKGESIEHLTARADEALYSAKQSGRNTIIDASTPKPPVPQIAKAVRTA